MKIQIEITNVIDLIPNGEFYNNPKFFRFRAKILLFNIIVNFYKYK